MGRGGVMRWRPTLGDTSPNDTIALFGIKWMNTGSNVATVLNPGISALHCDWCLLKTIMRHRSWKALILLNIKSVLGCKAIDYF